MRKQRWFCFLLLVTLISTLLPQAGLTHDTDSLSLSGTVKNVDGTVAGAGYSVAVSYTHLRAHETEADLVCSLQLEK